MPEKKETSITKPIFEGGKNFSIRVKPEQAELLNRLFEELDINPELSKTDRFIAFATKVDEMLNTDTSMLTEKLGQLTEENESLLSDKIELKQEIKASKRVYTSLETEFKTLEKSVSGLQTALEEEREKAPEIVGKPVNTPLEANQIIISLQPFQHHLLAKIASNSSLQAFYKAIPNESALILQLPDTENKKALMATVLQNIFVGTVLNFHQGAVYLPNIDRISSNKDINEAIAYAKKQAAENAKEENPPPNE